MTDVRLKVGEEVEVDIIAMGNDGMGIAKLFNYTIFIPFVCEGESVLARLNFVKKGIAYADLVSVLKESQDRRVPICSFFTKCGGCQFSHIDYEKQLSLKANFVLSTMQKIGGVKVSVGEIVRSKPYEYRNKLQLPVVSTRNGVKIGFFQQGTHKVVDINECFLQSKWAEKVIAVTKEFINKFNLSAYNEKTKNGLIKHIVCRYIDSQLLLTVVINGDELPFYDKLYEMLKAEFIHCGLFINKNKLHNNVIIYGSSVHLIGIEGIKSTTCGIEYILNPDSFFQVNDDIRERIYRDVENLAKNIDCDYIIDAFSGTGVLTAVLAKSQKQVFGIEIDRNAHQDAEKIKELNSLHNMTNICGDFFVEVVKLVENQKKLQKNNYLLVVDPARKGVSKEALEYIKKNAPNHIIYVSCNPSTLARDTQVLTADNQYEICQPITIYDQFAQTTHCEVMAHFNLIL